MKYWQRIFLCTLALFVLFFNAGAFLLTTSAYASSIEGERERNAALHAFICEALEKDILALDVRGEGENAYYALYESYAAFYGAQGIYIMILNGPDGKSVSNLPDQAQKAAAGTWGTAVGETGYMVNTGSVGNSGRLLVTARSTAPLSARADALSRRMLHISILAGALLCAALALLLKGLTRPVKELSRTAAAFANSGYTLRAKHSGRDEIAELAQNFNSMADSIQSNMAELEENSRRTQRFIDGMAHELRTPLAAISGYAQYLICADADGDDRRSALEYLDMESRRISSMQEKLMLLCNIREGEIKRAPADIRELVTSIAVRAKILFYAPPISAEISDCEWDIDADLLALILTNLLFNALRSGAGEVRIEADGRRIAVIDDGCGMEEDVLAHIREPFYRADAARSGGGCGLGLAVADAAAKRLGLELKFTSKPGAGTCAEVLQLHDSADTLPQ